MQNIRFGSKGSLVEALQLSLNRSGFLSDNIDGIFGIKTKTALENLQKAFTLDVTGKIDTATLAVIERFLKGFYYKKIKKGDTLWAIAADTGTPLWALLSANPTIDPDKLQIGQTITVPYPFSIVPTNISYSHYLTSNVISGLKARYPFISTETIGLSVMNKKIEAITIGNGKNQIFINSGFHANEWLNIPCVLKFAEDYLKAVATENKITDISAQQLFDNTALHLVPLVNPDGTDLVTGAVQSGEYYAQARIISADFPSLSFPSAWKANINGVDLNLQFPANWEKAREIKFAQGFTKPSPIEYVGSAPLSEPESKLIYEYTKNNDFKIILAYHSQGNIIYWKYLDYLPPESERIGQKLSKASDYPLELTPPESSYAGYKDWFIQDYNRPGYTIETGKGTNPLPISQFNDIYNANKPLIVKALTETINL